MKLFHLILFVWLLEVQGFSSEFDSISYHAQIFSAPLENHQQALYKKVIGKERDTLIEHYYLIKGNERVLEAQYIGEVPIGEWKHYNKDSLIEHWDFSLLYYDSEHKMDLDILNDLGESEKKQMIEKASKMYGEKSLSYPALMIESGITGTVYVQIVIQSDGWIQPFSIYQSVHPLLDYAAWSYLKAIQDTPILYNGEPVECYALLPINFRIQ